MRIFTTISVSLCLLLFTQSLWQNKVRYKIGRIAMAQGIQDKRTIKPDSIRSIMDSDVTSAYYPSNDNDSLKTLLLQCAYQGDEIKVTELLANGVSANAQTKDGTTALILASYHNANIVELLLTQGAKVEATTSVGWTALMSAVSSGQYNIARLLLNNGANANAKLKQDETSVLMKAAKSGFAEISKELIIHGSDINSVDKNGNTALILAADGDEDTLGGDLETLQVILEHKPNVNVVNRIGWSALMYAVSNQDSESVKALLRAGADPNQAARDGRTPLMIAATESDLDSIRELLNSKAGINIRDNKGLTALAYAFHGKHDDAVRLLKDFGAYE